MKPILLFLACGLAAAEPAATFMARPPPAHMNSFNYEAPVCSTHPLPSFPT